MFATTVLCPAGIVGILKDWRTVSTCAAAEAAVLADCVGELIGVVLGLHSAEIKGWRLIDWCQRCQRW